MPTARQILALVSPSKSIRPRNPERQAANFTRAYHSKERVLFVKALPCLVRSCVTRPSDNAHTENGGRSRKGHYTTIVPACRAHHDELDNSDGRRAFEQRYDLDLEICAALTQTAWEIASS